MGGILGGLLAVLGALAVLREWAALKVLDSLGCPWREHRPLHMASAILTIGWTLFAALFAPAVPLFFLGFHLAVNLSGLPYRGENRYGGIYIQVSFLLFATGFLVLMGLTALLQDDGLSDVIASPYLRILVISGAELFETVGGLLSVSTRAPWGGGEWMDRRATRTFELLLWCCICYVYMDGAFSAGGAADPFVSSLLVVGNLFLLLLLFLLFQREQLSVRDTYLQDERHLLEREQLTQRQRTRQLEEAALRDRLTGAWSRRSLEKLVEELRSGGVAFAAVYMDLDGLKRVNDAQGHEAGDRLLMEFVRALSIRLSPEDRLIRVGGDEFVALLPRRTQAAAELRMAELRAELSGLEPPLAFSFGAVPGTGSIESFIREADRAMYRDKRRTPGRGEAR